MINSLTAILVRAWGVVRPLPIRVFLIITATCILLEENYPFTHNPMYSALSARLRYYYVTDQNDDLVPFRQAFGYSLVNLMKKIKNRRAEAMQEAGVPKDNEDDILSFDRKVLPSVMEWYFMNRRAKGEFKGRPLPYQSITVIKILATREGRQETVVGSIAIPQTGGNH